jgi:hypothetical protein
MGSVRLDLFAVGGFGLGMVCPCTGHGNMGWPYAGHGLRCPLSGHCLAIVSGLAICLTGHGLCWSGNGQCWAELDIIWAGHGVFIVWAGLAMVRPLSWVALEAMCWINYVLAMGSAGHLLVWDGHGLPVDWPLFGQGLCIDWPLACLLMGWS